MDWAGTDRGMCWGEEWCLTPGYVLRSVVWGGIPIVYVWTEAQYLALAQRWFTNCSLSLLFVGTVAMDVLPPPSAISWLLRKQ